jgi:hypothetical protein
MALHRRKKLWIIRHARDKAFHLLLSGAGSNPSIQVRLKRDENAGKSIDKIAYRTTNFQLLVTMKSM